jgi:hypothetical protein
VRLHFHVADVPLGQLSNLRIDRFRSVGGDRRGPFWRALQQIRPSRLVRCPRNFLELYPAPEGRWHALYKASADRRKAARASRFVPDVAGMRVEVKTECFVSWKGG